MNGSKFPVCRAIGEGGESSQLSQLMAALTAQLEMLTAQYGVLPAQPEALEKSDEAGNVREPRPNQPLLGHSARQYGGHLGRADVLNQTDFDVLLVWGSTLKERMGAGATGGSTYGFGKRRESGPTLLKNSGKVGRKPNMSGRELVPHWKVTNSRWKTSYSSQKGDVSGGTREHHTPTGRHWLPAGGTTYLVGGGGSQSEG